MNGDGNKIFFNRGSFKLGLKHWIGTLIVAIVAGFVIFGLFRGQEFLTSFLVGRETKKQVKEALNRDYYDNEYGRKSPEKTFDMFLDALRNQDFESASRYFIIKKQDNFKEGITENQKKGQLQRSIQQLIEARNNWKLVKREDITATYEYEYILENPDFTEIPLGNGKVERIEYPPGKYKGQILFEKNPYTGIWKLYSL